MSCGLKHGGKAKKSRAFLSKRNRRSRKSQSKRKSRKGQQKNRRKRRRSSRVMRGGSTGLVNSMSAGVQESASKLMSSPYTPSSAHIQDAAGEYKGPHNQYYV
jgi:hypothetical protein